MDREKIREMASAANNCRYVNMSALAREVGWSHTQMYHFIRAGTGNAKTVEELGRVLTSLGFGSPQWSIVAEEMRVLAAICDSNMDAGAKLDALVRFLDSFGVQRLNDLRNS